jgi:hypothetical protein
MLAYNASALRTCPSFTFKAHESADSSYLANLAVFPEIHIVLNLVVCLQALNLSAGVFAALKTVVQPLACGAIFPAAKQTVLWFVAVLRPAS